MAADDAGAGLVVGVEGDAADGDVQVAAYSLLDGRVAAPVAQGEPAVDLRLLRVLRCEEGVELILRVDPAGVLLAQGSRLAEKCIGVTPRVERVVGGFSGGVPGVQAIAADDWAA